MRLPASHRGLSLHPISTSARFRAILDEAEAFIWKIPTDLCGMLFPEDGRVVQSEHDCLDSYQQHAAHRRGHWPGTAEIMSAMLDRYRENLQ